MPEPRADKRTKKLRSIDDLLTDEERKKLREDLAEIARRRRKGEAEAACLPMH